MAAKKSTARAPRQVWLVLNETTGAIRGSCSTRKGARSFCRVGERAVGPYVLAERVGER